MHSSSTRPFDNRFAVELGFDSPRDEVSFAKLGRKTNGIDLQIAPSNC